ncbi:MAG: terminase small subunit [Pseudomonadota bacterium]
MTDEPDRLVSARELAPWLGLSTPRVNELARQGSIKRHDGRKYALREAIVSYIATLREGQLGRTNSHPDLLEEKARLTRAQADKAEIQLAQTRGDLVKVDDVERAWSATLRDVRAGMLAVPSRVQQRLAHLTAHDVSEIDREVREVLAEIADEAEEVDDE